jgi:hypothetical protein
MRPFGPPPWSCSSPHARGYFHEDLQPLRCHGLFPARAGVFPSARPGVSRVKTLPRTRGGISLTRAEESSGLTSSPHARGYFRDLRRATARCPLFPARAGVFPAVGGALAAVAALPRTRGGISALVPAAFGRARSSPHARGYFRSVTPWSTGTSLFPARAEVFLHPLSSSPQAPMRRLMPSSCSSVIPYETTSPSRILWTSWKLAEKTLVQTRILALAGLQQMPVGEASRLTDRVDIQEVPRVAAGLYRALTLLPTALSRARTGPISVRTG